MIGFVVVNPEVIIARELERGGRYAPGIDFIAWRLAELRAEVADDAEFWGISRRDIARSRAAQLAEARGCKQPNKPNNGASPMTPRSSAVFMTGDAGIANVDCVKARDE